MTSYGLNAIKVSAKFDHDFAWERRSIKILVIIHILALVFGLLSWVILGNRVVIFTFLLAVIVIISTVCLLFILYLKYLTLPKIEEKKSDCK